MKVVPFFARNPAAALNQIHAQLGPEAVVLSIQPVPATGLARLWKKHQGIEVIAGVEIKDTKANRFDRKPVSFPAYLPKHSKLSEGEKPKQPKRAKLPDNAPSKLSVRIDRSSLPPEGGVPPGKEGRLQAPSAGIPTSETPRTHQSSTLAPQATGPSNANPPALPPKRAQKPSTVSGGPLAVLVNLPAIAYRDPRPGSGFGRTSALFEPSEAISYQFSSQGIGWRALTDSDLGFDSTECIAYAFVSEAGAHRVTRPPTRRE